MKEIGSVEVLKMSPEINTYISHQPPEVADRLKQLYATIYEIAPDVTERIAYHMPCFYHKQHYLCGFAAYQKHIGFYPGSMVGNGSAADIMTDFGERLLPYRTSKGTIQFGHHQRFDIDLIRDIIKWRLIH